MKQHFLYSSHYWFSQYFQYNFYCTYLFSLYNNRWGVTRAPDTIVDELKTMLYLGLMNNPGQEADFEEVTEKQTKAALPLFVRDPRINRKVQIESI
mmetsp:Transcript_4649/g.9078  ORF Transcript_4649/g.9078 Transcript_4649/m.9078 type:complete len:96 (+) Transcript_4649:706-993(+)